MPESIATPHEGLVKKKRRLLVVLKRLSSNKAAMLGLAVILTVVLMAVFAPWITPFSYKKVDIRAAFQTPNSVHLFGTDDMGRDILSRIIYGARYSLGLGISAMLIATIGGIFFGSIAGFFGGVVDQALMRFCDIIQSMPGILLNMALICAFGSGFEKTILALGVSNIAGVARLMRSSVLKERGLEYIDAARAGNCSSARIITVHVLPNAFAPILVQATMNIGNIILSVAGLSYLGLGVQPPAPEWSAMLSAGRNYIAKYPHMTIIPGLAIMVIVLAMNLLGDGLRDALDPMLKQ